MTHFKLDSDYFSARCEEACDCSEGSQLYEVEVGVIAFRVDSTTWVDSVILTLCSDGSRGAETQALSLVSDYLELNGASDLLAEVGSVNMA